MIIAKKAHSICFNKRGEADVETTIHNLTSHQKIHDVEKSILGTKIRAFEGNCCGNEDCYLSEKPGLHYHCEVCWVQGHCEGYKFDHTALAHFAFGKHEPSKKTKQLKKKEKQQKSYLKLDFPNPKTDTQLTIADSAEYVDEGPIDLRSPRSLSSIIELSD